ncbi:MAG TPA: hypothetical protein VIQ23_11175 [Hanamia sp.]
MANSIHLSEKGKVRRHKQKTEKEILIINSAKYINGFTIAISFTNGKTKLVDFLPLFHKYVKGENLNYFDPKKFKKFIVKDGNIYWGKNEDVIFPVNVLLKEKSENIPEEILYII